MNIDIELSSGTFDSWSLNAVNDMPRCPLPLDVTIPSPNREKFNVPLDGSEWNIAPDEMRFIPLDDTYEA